MFFRTYTLHLAKYLKIEISEMKKWILLVVVLCSNFFAKADGVDSLLAVLAKGKADTTAVNCLNKLSYMQAGKDSAQTLLNATKAYHLAVKISFTKGICEALYNLASFEEDYKYDFKAAEKYYLKGIELAQKSNLLFVEGAGMLGYSYNLKNQNRHKESLIINKKMVAIFTKLNDTAKLTKAYNKLGNNYKNLNQPERAIEALLTSLDLAKKLKDTSDIGSAYVNIGVVYDGSGDYDQALKNYISAIEYLKAGSNTNFLAITYGNIGAAYISLYEYAKAIPYLQKALNIHEAHKEIADIAFVLNNLSTANNYLQNYAEAIKSSTRSVALAKKVNDKELIAYGFLSLGVSYQGLKKASLAKLNFALAEKMIDSVNNTSYTMQVYAKIADFYAVNKNYEPAFNYYHKLIMMRDTIFNTEKHLQIATLQTKYETVEKEKALAKSQSEILQKVVQIQQKNNLLIASGLGILVIALAGFLFWRSAELRRLKEKIEKEKIASEAQDKMHEEKMRISRELHDSIGAQLTFINSSLEHLSPNDVQEIADTKTMTMNTIRELRSIVWLINKEEFFVDELAGKLRDLMKPLQNYKPKIDIISKGKENLKLNANIASNLFRIIQEATNNTIKYAQANSLNILIDTSDVSTLVLHIQDDGIGFVHNDNNLSFGLKNIASRVANVGGQYSIKSKVGSGTRIEIAIPIV